MLKLPAVEIDLVHWNLMSETSTPVVSVCFCWTTQSGNAASFISANYIHLQHLTTCTFLKKTYKNHTKNAHTHL